ncbi:hypothetical protein GDO81_027776 [Engystomops pustulosus]|uniref:Uncharacterized protein n=1 Tax=Engystomops pustulosus TaxID=76066 RepID=A0AAV6ZE95_ENGPU|nr:hypothetical protein GDO81_027776 [Engystomops pustulosus]
MAFPTDHHSRSSRYLGDLLKLGATRLTTLHNFPEDYPGFLALWLKYIETPTSFRKRCWPPSLYLPYLCQGSWNLGSAVS